MHNTAWFRMALAIVVLAVLLPKLGPLGIVALGLSAITTLLIQRTAS